MSMSGGTLNLVEAIRRRGGVRLVHLSSIAVYRARPGRAQVNEDSALGSARSLRRQQGRGGDRRLRLRPRHMDAADLLHIRPRPGDPLSGFRPRRRRTHRAARGRHRSRPQPAAARARAGLGRRHCRGGGASRWRLSGDQHFGRGLPVGGGNRPVSPGRPSDAAARGGVRQGAARGTGTSGRST